MCYEVIFIMSRQTDECGYLVVLNSLEFTLMAITVILHTIYFSLTFFQVYSLKYFSSVKSFKASKLLGSKYIISEIFSLLKQWSLTLLTGVNAGLV